MSPADLVARWRAGADVADHPAGPLYVGGEHAATEVADSVAPDTLHGCGTACTWSRTRLCC
jgi:hypothetical protein